jgi:hypothetical protein
MTFVLIRTRTKYLRSYDWQSMAALSSRQRSGNSAKEALQSGRGFTIIRDMALSVNAD